MFRSIYLFILLAIVSPLYGAEDPTETAIYMISQEDDKVGKNDTFVFDEESGALEIRAIKPANTKEIKGFSVIYYNGKGDSWQFKFVIPAKQAMVAGKKYAYAQSYPYHTSDKAGIKVCRIFEDFIDLQGEFKVLEYSLDPNGKVVSLAIDFKQVAGKKGSLHGSIRYRSKMPLTTNFETQREDDNSIPYTNEHFQHVFEFYSTLGDMGDHKKHFISKDIFFHPLRQSNNQGRNWLYIQGLDWIVNFAAPDISMPLEGVVYRHAEFHAFDTNPILLINIEGRHRILKSGAFKVLKIKYDDSGDIVELAIDFLCICYGAKDYPLHGTIRYNTHIRPSTEEEIRACLE